MSRHNRPLPAGPNTMPCLITDRKKLTVPQLARQWGVAHQKIIGWIKSGELRAVNLASTSSTRPRWAIDIADIESFERTREATPAVPRVRRERQAAGKDYFPHL